jgi:hypothetical protein
VHGHGIGVPDKGLAVVIPYLGALMVDVCTEAVIVRIIGDSYEARTQVLNPKQFYDAAEDTD